MATKYVKWARNADPQNDWTTERTLSDGTVIRMGEPVQLGADLVKELEAKGLRFEDSSADEAEQYRAQPSVAQPAGGDVAGTAPVFVDPETGVNQNAEPPSGDGDDKK